MSLILNPKFQMFDDDETFLVGGKLYTYLPGTTTEKATYSDRNLSSANANPVVLDDRGEATIYGTGLYKLVLKDSDDVTVWTLDNVEFAGGGGSYILYPDSSETDHGAAGNGASIYDYLTALGTSKKATIALTHTGASNTTSYVFGTSFDASTYTNVTFAIENGALLAPASGKAFTVPSAGHIDAGPRQTIKTGAGTIAFAEPEGVAYSSWWDTADIGARINEIVTALPVGGTLVVNAEDWADASYSTGIEIDKNVTVIFPGDNLTAAHYTGTGQAIVDTGIRSRILGGVHVDHDGNVNSNVDGIILSATDIKTDALRVTSSIRDGLVLHGELAASYGNMIGSARIHAAGDTPIRIYQGSADLGGPHRHDIQNVNITGDSGTFSAVSVSTLTHAAGTATATTATAHGLRIGDVVRIAGADQTEYNQDAVVRTAADTTHFTFGVASTAVSPATGTITSQKIPVSISLFGANRNTIVNAYPQNGATNAYAISSYGSGLVNFVFGCGVEQDNSYLADRATLHVFGDITGNDPVEVNSGAVNYSNGTQWKPKTLQARTYRMATGTHTAFTDSTTADIYGSSAGGTAPFDETGHIILEAAAGSSKGIYIVTGTTGNMSWIWRILGNKAITYRGGTTGGLTRKVAEATASITAAATITIHTNVPTGSKLLNTQLQVESALAAGELWDAAYSGGATQAIATAQAVAVNTEVGAFFDANADSDIASGEVDIAITKNGGGNFTAQGLIRAIVYYEINAAMTNV